MNKIPYLDFFSYEKMLKYPGLYQIMFAPGYSESFSEHIIFNIIEEALLNNPEKILIISFEKPIIDNLFNYLKKNNISKANIHSLENHEDFLEWYMNLSSSDKSNIGGLFVSNPNFFLNKYIDNNSIQIAAKAINSKKFHIQTKDLIQVFSQEAQMKWAFHYGNKEPMTNVATKHIAQTLISINIIDKKRAVITCDKDISGVPDISVTVQFDKNEQLIPYIKNENNFFQIKDPKALITIKNRRLITKIKNSYNFFENYNVTKSVKKAILEKSIKEKKIDNTELKYVSITYDYINLLTIMKEIYQENFDPNYFCTAVKENYAFYLPIDDYIKNKYDLFEFFSLTNQKNIYQWINKASESKFKDTFNGMFLSLKEKKVEIPKTINFKKLSEAHDALSEILDSINPQLNQKITSQTIVQNLNNQEIKINEESLIIHIPADNRALRNAGEEMKLCISNEWFWNILQMNNQAIILMKNNNKLKYCIKVDEEGQVLEAKSQFNQELHPNILEQIQEVIKVLFNK